MPEPMNTYEAAEEAAPIDSNFPSVRQSAELTPKDALEVGVNV